MNDLVTTNLVLCVHLFVSVFRIIIKAHSFSRIWCVLIYQSQYPFDVLIVTSQVTGSSSEPASVSFGSDP